MSDAPDFEKTVPGQLDTINARLDEGEIRMGRLERSLAENTAATKRVEANTAELIEWSKAFQGAFKVLDGMGKLAKPVTAIVGVVAACAAAWAAFKAGK